MRRADHVRPLRQHDRPLLGALDTNQVVHAEEVEQPAQLGLIDLDSLGSSSVQGSPPPVGRGREASPTLPTPCITSFFPSGAASS